MIARARLTRASSQSRPAWLACEAAPPNVDLAIEKGTLSVREKVDVLLRDSGWLEAAAAIPEKAPGSVGRNRTYPAFVWTLWSDLRDIFGSHTAVQRELGRGRWWRYIRRELRRLRPELPELPHRPPRRQAFEYMRDAYLATDEGIARSAEIHARMATRKAKEGGNLDPTGGGSWTHPEISRTLYGDGKVITPLYTAKPGDTVTNRETGEVRLLRFDPDADSFTEGGGDPAYGNKVAIISTRGPDGRFILAVDRVEKGKDEPKAMLEGLRRIKPYAPGAQALVWDMIVRGVHIQTILTEIGLVPVVQVHAKEKLEEGEDPKKGSKKGRKRGSYVPKTLDLEDVGVTMPDGTAQTLHIAACDGAVSVKTLTETGDPHYEPLECVRIQRNPNKRSFRWYGYYRLGEEYGSKIIGPIRLHQDDEDARRRINRTENLRAIPEGSEDYDRLHVLRPDAESVNRGIEDVLYINRATAKGWRRQMVDLLGHARLVNAITLARCRARERLAVPA